MYENCFSCYVTFLGDLSVSSATLAVKVLPRRAARTVAGIKVTTTSLALGDSRSFLVEQFFHVFHDAVHFLHGKFQRFVGGHVHACVF